MSHLSGELSQALCAELGVRELSEKFAAGIARALHRYVTHRATWRMYVETEHEIDKILISARRLMNDLAAILPQLRDLKRRGTMVQPHYIDEEFRDLKRSIETMFCLLDEDGNEVSETDVTSSRGRRGNPHEGREYLRQDTLEAIEDLAGVKVTKSASCMAAKLLARVLEEADRRDGLEACQRAEFSGKQWNKWVDQYHHNREDIFGPGPSPFRQGGNSPDPGN